MTPPLTVQTLGRFEVIRGDSALSASDWGREKAIQLFQYFVTHQGSLIHKTRMFEDLWPELSEDKAERDFKVAFNALNDALEPERASRTTAVYLERQGPSYGLNPHAPIDIDFTAFETVLNEREKSARLASLQDALKLYQGDFLPEQLFADWTAATRERLSSLFLFGATELAQLLLEAEKLMACAYWCERIIAQDSYWEEAYRLLMHAHLRLGNRPKVKELYLRLQATLQDGLSLSPMPATTTLYQAALKETAL
jgi:LuxR family transcriptional regulator, maltose regulon positive regulatory protein